MATVTASILAGDIHQNDAGIIPRHQLLLFEGNRPYWQVFDLEAGLMPYVWIPTLENTLEDGILMFSVYAAQITEIVDDIGKYIDIKRDYLEMYTDFTETDRETLYASCRANLQGPKLAISIYHSSLISKQLSVLKHYSFSFEICTSDYLFEHNPWTGKPIEVGRFPGEAG